MSATQAYIQLKHVFPNAKNARGMPAQGWRGRERRGRRPWARTVQKLRALGVALLHLLALVRGSLQVAVGHGEHRGPRLHQELTHLHVVAGRGAVQRGPVGETQRAGGCRLPDTTAQRGPITHPATEDVTPQLNDPHRYKTHTF